VLFKIKDFDHTATTTPATLTQTTTDATLMPARCTGGAILQLARF